jgi:hypothetical protein
VIGASSTSTLGAVIPSALACDLGEAMALHLWDHSGSVLQAGDVATQLARVAEIDHMRGVEEFVRRVDAVVADEARRDFAIAVHPVQVRSKLWLIDELTKHCDLGTSSLLVLGGWYGILPMLFNWRLTVPPPQMVSIDTDAVVGEAGARLIGSLYPNVEYRCEDAMELDYGALGLQHPPVVINTICEHLLDVAGWWNRIPRGQLVALQSNNYEGCPDHVSAVASIEEFKRQLPLSELLFEGVLELPPWFDRYMLIGRR